MAPPFFRFNPWLMWSRLKLLLQLFCHRLFLFYRLFITLSDFSASTFVFVSDRFSSSTVVIEFSTFFRLLISDLQIDLLHRLYFLQITSKIPQLPFYTHLPNKPSSRFLQTRQPISLTNGSAQILLPQTLQTLQNCRVLCDQRTHLQTHLPRQHPNPPVSPLLPCKTISPSSPLCSTAAHCRQDPSTPKIADPISCSASPCPPLSPAQLRQPSITVVLTHAAIDRDLTLSGQEDRSSTQTK